MVQVILIAQSVLSREPGGSWQRRALETAPTYDSYRNERQSTLKRRGCLFVAGWRMIPRCVVRVLSNEHTLSQTHLVQAFLPTSPPGSQPTYEELMTMFPVRSDLYPAPDDESGGDETDIEDDDEAHDDTINGATLRLRKLRKGRKPPHPSSRDMRLVVEEQVPLPPWPQNLRLGFDRALSLIPRDPLRRRSQGAENVSADMVRAGNRVVFMRGAPGEGADDMPFWDTDDKTLNAISMEVVRQFVGDLIRASPKRHGKEPRHLNIKDHLAYTVDLMISLDLRGLFPFVFAKKAKNQQYFESMAMKHFLGLETTSNEIADMKHYKHTEYVRMWRSILKRAANNTIRKVIMDEMRKVVGAFHWVPMPSSAGLWLASREKKGTWCWVSPDFSSPISAHPVPRKYARHTHLHILINPLYKIHHIQVGKGPQPIRGPDKEIELVFFDDTTLAPHNNDDPPVAEWTPPADLDAPPLSLDEVLGQHDTHPARQISATINRISVDLTGQRAHPQIGRDAIQSQLVNADGENEADWVDENNVDEEDKADGKDSNTGNTDSDHDSSSYSPSSNVNSDGNDDDSNGPNNAMSTDCGVGNAKARRKAPIFVTTQPARARHIRRIDSDIDEDSAPTGMHRYTDVSVGALLSPIPAGDATSSISQRNASQTAAPKTTRQAVMQPRNLPASHPAAQPRPAGVQFHQPPIPTGTMKVRSDANTIPHRQSPHSHGLTGKYLISMQPPQRSSSKAMTSKDLLTPGLGHGLSQMRSMNSNKVPDFAPTQQRPAPPRPRPVVRKKQDTARGKDEPLARQHVLPQGISQGRRCYHDQV
jgi:hypothetical protein